MRYVGVTRRPILTRFKMHIKAAETGKGSDDSFQQAIRNYGSLNFNVDLIDTASTDEELSSKEIAWIENLGTLWPNGYNQNRGGAIYDSGKIYIVNGKEYKGLSKLADAFGILEITMHKRMQSGFWSIEQACGLVPPPNIRRKGDAIEIAGKSYDSKTQAAKEHGIDKRVLDTRLRYGWSLEEALELVDRKRSSFIVNGETYPSFVDACKAHGLNIKKVDSRIRLGWSVSEAFEITKRAPTKRTEWRIGPLNGRKFEVNGQVFNSLSKLAAAFGIGVGTASYRYRTGWSLEQVAGLAPPPNNNAAAEIHHINGKKFESTAALCKHFDIDVSTFRARTTTFGWSVEEALEVVSRPDIDRLPYVVTAPSGEVRLIKNFALFAKDHKLSRGGAGLQAVATRRKLHSWRGWKLRHATESDLTSISLLPSGEVMFQASELNKLSPNKNMGPILAT